jgi:3-hydroxybutyryl-CoA dehydrogenase
MGIRKIAVVGSGSMGSAIAEIFAFNGFEVILKDQNIDLVNAGIGRIRKILQGQLLFQEGRSSKEISRIESLGVTLSEDQKEAIRKKMKPELTENKVAEIMGRIRPAVDYSGFEDVDYVVEAVFENMEVKKSVMKELSAHCRENAIISTNTSSLSITKISSFIMNPERSIVTHFFNPPYTLPLVEIVPGIRTSDSTVKEMIEFYSKLKNHRGFMRPIRVKEVPGFLVNRILVPVLNEAAIMLDEGVADAGDIDTAMKLGAGFPMGPLELADMVGIDVTFDVIRILYEEYADQKYRPSLLLKRMVDSNKLGIKNGEGFYSH